MASPQPASPRRSRGFSFSAKSDNSHKTHRSSGSGHKLDLTESPEEKARRSLHTKADPMLAMSEAQPNLVALEKSNLGSLRAIQHKDQYGNPITEPDLSNPTRSRFERPLDTIRSFEAAIYGPYNSSRPVSFARTFEESPSGAEYSRRSSYYNGYSNGQYVGSYNGRQNYSRPNSYIDNGNGYYNGGAPPENYYPYNQNSSRPRPRPHPSRGYSDQPSYANNGYSQDGYAQYGNAQSGYHKSTDNVTVASPSGSGSNPDQWGNSTDPSSVSSSMDQQQLQQQQLQQQHGKPAENYGFQGFGPGPDVSDQFNPNATEQPPYGQAPPPPPHKSIPNPNMGGPVGGQPLTGGRRHLQRKAVQQSVPSDAADNGTKRKSWFKRRFSKN
ncbi:uncharacterized protein BJX67DRAFT_155899 [Aspergillus lucknowensis]|uniref:DUF2406 domain protein n=1 Tax=Aspergillus lucknowensis TaxID=176173 RepID=A0ABR4LN23_9EURO